MFGWFDRWYAAKAKRIAFRCQSERAMPIVFQLVERWDNAPLAEKKAMVAISPNMAGIAGGLIGLVTTLDD